MASVEGSLDEVLRRAATWRVIHGAALHIPRTLPDGVRRFRHGSALLERRRAPGLA
jgi:hypothetical protein